MPFCVVPCVSCRTPGAGRVNCLEGSGFGGSTLYVSINRMFCGVDLGGGVGCYCCLASEYAARLSLCSVAHASPFDLLLLAPPLVHSFACLCVTLRTACSPGPCTAGGALANVRNLAVGRSKTRDWWVALLTDGTIQ